MSRPLASPLPSSAVEARGNQVATFLGFVLIAAVTAFGCWLVGTRSFDLGTDTRTYAGFFLDLRQGLRDSRMEPGFVYLSYLLSSAGLGVAAYFAALFALLLAFVAMAAHGYARYLGDTGFRAQTLLCASLMLLFVSPMFVNASVNALRQGLAAPLVFAALLAFEQRRWWRFVLLGALGSAFHLSTLLYLAFAPMLLLRPRTLRWVAAVALVVYCAGLSQWFVRTLVPPLYTTVMEYTAHERLRAGIRLDFAVFSAFWYWLPHLLSPLIREPWRERIMRSTAIYLVMLMPFFVIGWGYFSNRYLLPAWLAVSLVLAAVLCHSTIALLRSPTLIRAGMVGACGVFYWLVTHYIVI